MLNISNMVRERYAGIKFGIMIMERITVKDTNIDFERAKTELESLTRDNFAGFDKKKMRTIAPFSDYHAYYKRFKKTYHVLHQCESIASGKRTLPNGPPLVQAMFMAEIKNQLLTAGYDYTTLEPLFNVKLASGESGLDGMGMKKCSPPQNDIIFSDKHVLLGSIICGPDHEHRIQPATTDVLFAIYGVPGITAGQMESHFKDIRSFVRLFSPEATMQEMIIE